MRRQYGECVAINDAYEKIWKQGNVVDKVCIYQKGEEFEFWLEDGWLYHLIKGRRRICVQYAVFDEDFKIFDEVLDV